MTGQRIDNTNGRAALDAVRAAVREKNKLREIFFRSLGN
jgi:hypothetical protein